MKLVLINDLEGNEITHATFDTEEEAQVWVTLQEGKTLLPWGYKKERWLREDQFDDETIESSIENKKTIIYPAVPESTQDELDSEGNPTGETTVIPAIPEVSITTYKFAKEYEVSVEDITRKERLENLRGSGKRKKLFVEADIEINIMYDNNLPHEDWKSYRQSLRDVTNNYKTDGKANANCDNLDVKNFNWPAKPQKD